MQVHLPFSMDTAHDLVWMFSSTMLFYVIRKACHSYTPLAATLSSEQIERLHNYSVSLIHAVITSILVVACFYFHPEFTDNITTKNFKLHHLVITFATGYFVYDLFDNIASRPLEKSKDILLHHVITIIAFSYAVITHTLIGLGILALVSELNSVFLHSRQLVKLMIGRNNILYTATSLGTILSFVMFRLYLIHFFLFKLLEIGHNIAQPYISLIWCAFIIMAVVNIILFVRLLKSDSDLWIEKIKIN